MKVGSAFSGIGVFDIAFESIGAEIAWQCEIDPACTDVLYRHFPHVPVHYHDIKDAADEEVDLVCGGFPCQDLSIAGDRAGLAGKRSGLFFEFMRIVAELGPQWVVIENVPGLLSSNGGRDMGTVLTHLAELGYGWAYRILDAQYFGVPQRRRRVFIVGCAGDARRAGKVLFEPACGRGNPAPRRQSKPQVARTTNGSARDGGPASAFIASSFGGSGADDNSAQAHHLVAAPLTAGQSRSPGVNPPGRRQEDDVNLVTHSRTRKVYNPYRTYNSKDGGIDIGFGERDIVDALHGPTGNKEPLLIDGEPARALTAHTQGIRYDGESDNLIAYNVYPAPGQGADLAATETDLAMGLSATDGKLHDRGTRVVDPDMAVRRLTPLECERLQGLPDGWTEGPSDSVRYRMIGNSMAVPVVEWIARRIWMLS